MLMPNLMIRTIKLFFKIRLELRNNDPFFNLLMGIGKKSFLWIKKKIMVRIIRFGINMAHILLYQYQKEKKSPKLYFCPKCQKCIFEFPPRDKKIFV